MERRADARPATGGSVVLRVLTGGGAAAVAAPRGHAHRHLGGAAGAEQLLPADALPHRQPLTYPDAYTYPDSYPYPESHPYADELFDAGAQAGASDAVRVFLLGPDALARSGLRMLLDGQPGIAVVGDDESGPRSLATLCTAGPDVVVLHGVADPREIGLLAEQLGDGVRLVAVGGAGPRDEPDARDTVLSAHLPTSVTPADLAAAVRMAAAGYRVLRDIPGVRPRPTGGPASDAEDISSVSAVDPRELTAREREVIDLIARGSSNAEIARELLVSEHTVKSHVQNLLHKLKLRNRVHAVVYAFETGLRRPC
ncbi:response regulator transcription factor [Streptomyces sp. NPDC001709]